MKKDTTLQEEVKNIITEKKDIFTKNSKFNELLNEYLDKFGNRAIYELKLESLTLKENPIFLLEMIYSLSLKNNENSNIYITPTSETLDIDSGSPTTEEINVISEADSNTAPYINLD